MFPSVTSIWNSLLINALIEHLNHVPYNSSTRSALLWCGFTTYNIIDLSLVYLVYPLVSYYTQIRIKLCMWALHRMTQFCLRVCIAKEAGGKGSLSNNGIVVGGTQGY